MIIPSLQSLVGAHSGTGNCAVDWTENIHWQLSGTHLAAYDAITGLEISYLVNDLTTLQAENYSIGLTMEGLIALTGGSGLYAGGLVLADIGPTLDFSNGVAYPATQFGQGQMCCTQVTGFPIVADRGIGSSVIGSLNRTQISQAGPFVSVWLDTVGWPAGYFRCQLCPGPLESTKIYAAYSNNLGVKLDRLDCGVLSFDGVTNLQTWAAAAFDATWTHADISGICYDATDDTLIMVVLGNGTVINKLVKVDKNPGSSIIWTADIPNNFGAELGVGSCFQFCDIQNGRLGLFTNSPAKVTIYDTSDGSVVSQYTTGLAGINQIGYQGGQCYNDTLGAICLPMGFTQTTGSPSLLNSTPASFSGWSLLYAGNAVVVSSGDPDGWFQVMKPVTPLS